MATSYTLHTTDCASAIEQNAPVVSPGDYPAARWHRYGYYTDPKPEQARVTQIEGEIPPAPPE